MSLGVRHRSGAQIGRDVRIGFHDVGVHLNVCVLDNNGRVVRDLGVGRRLVGGGIVLRRIGVRVA